MLIPMLTAYEKEHVSERQPLPEKYLGLSDAEMVERIAAAKARLGRRVIILGHHYQRDEVIKFADYTGDSFKLARHVAVHPDNNQMRKLPAPSAADSLRVHAVARLMCDNIPHVKAFWIATGVEVAQIALWFGVDDLDGTVQEEKIYHMAGARTPESMSPKEIERLISTAGRQPVERDTFYNIVAHA